MTIYCLLERSRWSRGGRTQGWPGTVGAAGRGEGGGVEGRENKKTEVPNRVLKLANDRGKNPKDFV